MLSFDDRLNIFPALDTSEGFREAPDDDEARGTAFAVTDSVEIRNLDKDSLVSATDDARGAGDALSVLPEIDLLLRGFCALDNASICSYTEYPRKSVSARIPRPRLPLNRSQIHLSCF